MVTPLLKLSARRTTTAMARKMDLARVGRQGARQQRWPLQRRAVSLHSSSSSSPKQGKQQVKRGACHCLNPVHCMLFLVFLYLLHSFSFLSTIGNLAMLLRWTGFPSHPTLQH
jgi:hypothetical protein